MTNAFTKASGNQLMAGTNRGIDFLLVYIINQLRTFTRNRIIRE